MLYHTSLILLLLSCLCFCFSLSLFLLASQLQLEQTSNFCKHVRHEAHNTDLRQGSVAGYRSPEGSTTLDKPEFL